MLAFIVNFLKERYAANPSRQFRVALREKLAAMLPVETPTWHRHAALRRTAVGVVVLLPLLFAGTSAYAYSSASVTEGNALYPLKRGIESMHVRFRYEPDDRAAYQLELYERRLDEAERLLEQRNAMIETLNAAVEVNDLLESLERLQGDHEEMHERLQSNQARYETVRLRVYVTEPSGELPLRVPSFMIRRMHD